MATQTSICAVFLSLLLSFGAGDASFASSRTTTAAFSTNVGKRPTARAISLVDRYERTCDSPCVERQLSASHKWQLFTSPRDNDKSGEGDDGEAKKSSRSKIASRVKDLARSMIVKPLGYVVPMPQAIAAILKEASLAAVEEVEEVINRSTASNKEIALQRSKVMVNKLIDEAFAPMEASLDEMESSIAQARKSLTIAKTQSTQAIEAIQVAAIAQAEGAATAVAQAEAVAERQIMKEIYSSAGGDVNITGLTFDEVDYDSSEMAPPFLDQDSCLVPGEPVVRVEKAPENSRRIFAGIDIMASVDDVWKVLTDYDNLKNVVPNLVINEVLGLYDDKFPVTSDQQAPAEVQCKQIAEQMKGSLLKQVGGAKVAGINFSARTTLEVREWPNGMPDFAHFTDDMWQGKSREARAKEQPNVQLTRYRFPRPFALSSLPTRDISMQSIINDDGEFRMYQGVWRMQPLPGCAPPGKQAMRLTYAVEISPRAYLPVRLVEGRIVADLCTNLKSIRNVVSTEPARAMR